MRLSKSKFIQLIARPTEWSARMAMLKKAHISELGCFFLFKGKPFISSQPWTEVTSCAGFRTHPVDHPDYWKDLQRIGAVPKDMPYEECPRGRVNYEDATGRFTLFADKCIIKNQRLVSKIMNKLSLPKDTRVVPDNHYRCSKCLRKKPTRKQEEEDWGL